MRLPFARSFLAALVLAAQLGCAKTSSVVESRPLTADFDGYQTGAVEINPQNIEGGEKASRELLQYLEAKLRQGGVLEPIDADKGAQLLLRVHATSLSGEEDVRLLVDFIDAKTGETIGQIAISANALGGNGSAALRRVADEVVTYMRTNRRAAVSAKASRGSQGSAASAPTVLAPASAATERPAAAGVVTSGGCTTTCTPDSSSALSPDDQKKVADGLTPLLKELRVCLDRVNAQEIHPAVIGRFETNGAMSQVRVDAGGFDNLACVQEARSRAPQVMISRGASVRCEYRCRK